jgi:hypothetical protein|tara:strand:+ start:314 stop:1024 length:711 start_codon:yes stop_codon:yes gene_type:complete
MAEGQKEKVVDSTKNKVTMLPITLGSLILKFELPLTTIDAINKSYDENLRNLRPHNKQLAGKIKEENQVTDLLTEEMKQTFLACFGQYLKQIQKPFWGVSLAKAWINEMRSGEYNPFHYHVSELTDLGLSSVIVLKRPKTYGTEIVNPDDHTNGFLEFVGGNQDPLGLSQYRVDAQVGDFFIFPYTMLHGVYPFRETDEVRRTLSYNCDLLKPKIIDYVYPDGQASKDKLKKEEKQ